MVQQTLLLSLLPVAPGRARLRLVHLLGSRIGHCQPPSTCRWTCAWRLVFAAPCCVAWSILDGHTATYATVALLAGSPKAVRAVGTACATNPLPIVVPCHRVVRSDGGIGGYLGGVEAKRVLLSLGSAA